MRAWQFTSVPSTLGSALTLNDNAPTPTTSLPKGSTLVKVAYTSLNPVDFKIFELPMTARLLTRFGSSPQTPCLDYAGTVVSTTRSDLKAGDRVYGKLEPPFFGAAKEYIVVGEQGCAALPDGVSFEQAGGVGVAGLTAWQCIVPYLERAQKVKGKSSLRVFVNGGSGGTGTFGIQIAKAMGATVVTTCSARNTELVNSLGASEVIDYTSQDVVAELTKLAERDGMFDLAVDNVGGATPLYFQSHQYLAPHASFVCVGATPGPMVAVDMARIFLTPGVLGGGRRPYVFLTCKTDKEGYAGLGKMMAEGKVKTVIEKVLDVEQLPEGFERIKTGRVKGKLVVKIGGEN
jgi:NADPH:quinone reductase-like Zn-dependent oxidoreductase